MSRNKKLEKKLGSDSSLSTRGEVFSRNFYKMIIEHLAAEMDFTVDECMNFIKLFIKTTSSEIEDLKSAVSAGRADLIMQTAHSMKGAAANMNLTAFSELGKKIEENARNNKLDEIPEFIETLEQKLDSLIKDTYET